jgi:hypothetical protein
VFSSKENCEETQREREKEVKNNDSYKTSLALSPFNNVQKNLWCRKLDRITNMIYYWQRLTISLGKKKRKKYIQYAANESK